VVDIKVRIPGLSQAVLARFVSRAQRAAKLRGEVNVLVTNNGELRRLNRCFRGKNRPTDVLSFPAVRDAAKGLAGDVAISAQMAAYNAHRLGHTTTQEIQILVLHGILHLAGYDHERDNGQMASTEARLRAALGLPLGLIERNQPKQRERAPMRPKRAMRA